MPLLEPTRISKLLQPYAEVSEALANQLGSYLDLLVRWNARTNLTAIRAPEEMVTRHFGESLFAGAVLAAQLQPASRLLDLGSGAGFPGLPIQLAHPEMTVTLAESQNKKATFLREAVRTLALPTEVFAARAETIPPERLFEVVTMRAVDNPLAAFQASIARMAEGGIICLLAAVDTATPEGLIAVESREMPGANRTAVHIYRKA